MSEIQASRFLNNHMKSKIRDSALHIWIWPCQRNSYSKRWDQFHVSIFHNNQVRLVSLKPSGRDRMDLVKHTGGCHCGAVRFEVLNSPDLHVFHCNCSICTKKQNHHFIVPKKRFTLLQGLDSLTTYTFNTHVAKHTFCKICGVQSFYSPRSNPDGYGVAPHCLDPGSVRSVTVENFCGAKWEESMQAHKTIQDMSKLVENID